MPLTTDEKDRRIAQLERKIQQQQQVKLDGRQLDLDRTKRAKGGLAQADYNKLLRAIHPDTAPNATEGQRTEATRIVVEKLGPFVIRPVATPTVLPPLTAEEFRRRAAERDARRRR